MAEPPAASPQEPALFYAIADYISSEQGDLCFRARQIIKVSSIELNIRAPLGRSAITRLMPPPRFSPCHSHAR